jgi:hypothetical protein
MEEKARLDAEKNRNATFWIPENIKTYTNLAQLNFQKAFTPGSKNLSTKDALR